MRWRSLHYAVAFLLAVHPQVIVRLRTGKTWRIVWSLAAVTACNGDVITAWHVLRDCIAALAPPPASRPLQLPA